MFEKTTDLEYSTHSGMHRQLKMGDPSSLPFLGDMLFGGQKTVCAKPRRANEALPLPPLTKREGNKPAEQINDKQGGQQQQRGHPL